MVWYLIGGGGPDIYQCSMLMTQAVWPPAPLCNRRMQAKCSGQLEWGRRLLEVESRGIKQDFIPYVGQLELANVPIEGWIIDPDEHGPLNDPWDVLWLPTFCGEVFYPSVMICGVGMVIYGKKGPWMIHEHFPIGSWRFLYVLLITLQPVTLVPAEYSSFLCDVIPILGGHQVVFFSTLPQMFSKLLLKPLL